MLVIHNCKGPWEYMRYDSIAVHLALVVHPFSSVACLQVWFQNRRAKWRRAQKANQLVMGELMSNGRGVGVMPGVGLPPMPGMMPPGFATAPANLSPGSSVLMTPKSANTPPSHMFQAKPFVLHHPNHHTPASTMPYSSPWSGQNQFIFPSPTAMSFSNHPALSSSSPICSTTTMTAMTPQW